MLTIDHSGAFYCTCAPTPRALPRPPCTPLPLPSRSFSNGSGIVGRGRGALAARRRESVRGGGAWLMCVCVGGGGRAGGCGGQGAGGQLLGHGGGPGAQAHRLPGHHPGPRRPRRRRRRRPGAAGSPCRAPSGPCSCGGGLVTLLCCLAPFLPSVSSGALCVHGSDTSVCWQAGSAAKPARPSPGHLVSRRPPAPRRRRRLSAGAAHRRQFARV
jgi:hypothetical protein